MQQQPGVGVAVMILKDGQVLMGKRLNAHGAGTWAFPGGHLEHNEDIEACARREVLEETGVQLTNLRFGPYTNDIFVEEGKHYVTLFVIADYAGGTVELREPDRCAAWLWCDWEALPQPLFLPMANLLRLGFNPPETERYEP